MEKENWSNDQETDIAATDQIAPELQVALAIAVMLLGGFAAWLLF